MPSTPAPLRYGAALLCLAATLSAQDPLLSSNHSIVSPVVPGRFIVTYRSGVLPAMPHAHTLQREARLGMDVLQVIPAEAAATLRQLTQDPAVESVVADRYITAQALSVQAAPALSVVAAPTPATPSDTLYNSPHGWAVRQVGGFGDAKIPGPWSTTTGAGIRVAILDSGVDPNHPDLAPNLVLNLSDVDQSAATGIPTPCDDGSPIDQQGHGSWTASLAAAAIGPGTGMIAGVAPSASILNIKVMQRMPASPTAADPTGCNAGQAGGLLSWLIHGIQDAVANNAAIISMSLGAVVDVSTGDGAALQVLMNHVTHTAAQAGAVLIAAAGNDGINFDSPSAHRLVTLPAQSQDVLAIIAATNPACAENLTPGATCAAGPVTRPYYSNYGASLNALAAPGGSYPSQAGPNSASGWIYGACSNGLTSTLSGPPSDSAHSYGCFGLGHAQYIQVMGTSAAAPLAAGAAALLRAAHPNWSPAAVIDALRGAAVPTSHPARSPAQRSVTSYPGSHLALHPILHTLRQLFNLFRPLDHVQRHHIFGRLGNVFVQ